MTNTKNLVIKLKEVREEKNLSYKDITEKIEQNGGYPPSKATLSRVFAEGSESEADSFSYEKTLMPIANAILDVEVDEEADDMDTRALKALLKSKKEYIGLLESRISELETALDKEKIKHHEKLEADREGFAKSINFLKEQVAYKDKRMDLLLNAVQKKDELHEDMLKKLLACSACKMSKAQ